MIMRESIKYLKTIDIIVPTDYVSKWTDQLNHYQELKESISVMGIVAPIAVRKHDEEYYLLDGHIRLKIALELGIETIPTLIFELP